MLNQNPTARAVAAALPAGSVAPAPAAAPINNNYPVWDFKTAVAISILAGLSYFIVGTAGASNIVNVKDGIPPISFCRGPGQSPIAPFGSVNADHHSMRCG